MKLPKADLDAVVPAILLAAGLLLLVAGAPTAFVWFDQLRHWGQALEQIRNGVWLPPRGASVTGVGANGPLYHLILMGGLRFLSSETAMAFYSAASAAVGLTATAVLAARRWGLSLAVWPLAAVVCHPILMEWMRVGLDHSFLPLWSPLALAAWLFVERRPGSPGAWLLWGVACGAGLQLHFTVGPALALASLALWQPRDAPWAPLATLAGTALTYVTLMAGPAPQSPGLTWFEAPQTAWRLTRAALTATSLRAAGVGWASPWWTTAGGFFTAAAVLGALLGRARRAVRRSLAVAAASLLLVSFDERSHYHHLMHLDVFMMAMTVAGAITLAAAPAGRVVLAGVLTSQLALGVRMVDDALAAGVVELPSSYPVAWPDERELAATAIQRDRLAVTLNALALDHPLLRQDLVFGDVLPYFEHGWMFLVDHRAPATGGAADAGYWRLERGPCPDATGRQAGALCMAPAAARPEAVRPDLDGGFVPRTAVRGSLWRQGVAFPPEMAQLEVVRRIAFPLRLESGEGPGFAGLTLRVFRFPLAMELIGNPPLWPAALPDPDHKRSGYTLREYTWTFSLPVSEIELHSVSGADILAFSAELTRAGR